MRLTGAAYRSSVARGWQCFTLRPGLGSSIGNKGFMNLQQLFLSLPSDVTRALVMPFRWRCLMWKITSAPSRNSRRLR